MGMGLFANGSLLCRSNLDCVHHAIGDSYVTESHSEVRQNGLGNAGWLDILRRINLFLPGLESPVNCGFADVNLNCANNGYSIKNQGGERIKLN